MRIERHIRGSVLPTVIVVSVLILTGMLGLLALWEQEALVYARSCRLRQARADVESAYALYRLHPQYADSAEFRICDSLASSLVRLRAAPWGLYETVSITTGDSLVQECRLCGVKPDTTITFSYADNRSALNLAGRTILQGILMLPKNGLVYGRVDADFYSGREISRNMIRRSDTAIPTPDAHATHRIARLFAESGTVPASGVPDSLHRSFRDSTIRFRVGDAGIGNCTLDGNIVLYADELRIDASCRMSHLLICARKVTVGEGTRIAAQIFVSDTVIVESHAVLEYPSGIYSQTYAELGERAEVNGYVIVRDTVLRKKVTASCRLSRTARVRGLVWVDGIAQVQGIVSGQLILRQAVYFSPQGYYKDMLYDVTLLTNPHTTHPLWLGCDVRRKEVVCVH